MILAIRFFRLQARAPCQGCGRRLAAAGARVLEAVEKAGTTDPAAVQAAIIGVSVPNLTGGYATMAPNHHITKPVLIGEIQDDGQFEVVWETSGTVLGDAWSDFLPGSKDLISDWRSPLSCGNYNVKTAKCSGQNL